MSPARESTHADRSQETRFARTPLSSAFALRSPSNSRSAQVTCLRAARLFRCVHAELFQLARERVAPPAQKLRGLLAVPLRALERRADEYTLELGLCFVEEGLFAIHRVPVGPDRQRFG